MVFARHHSKTALWFLDTTEICGGQTPQEKFCTLTFVSFRNDGSIFDGLVEEDDKDKAKR